VNRFLLIASALSLAATLSAASIADHYAIEEIALPPGLNPQVGGLSVSPNGTLFACFHRGEVFTYNSEHKHWHQFAFGLHEPLGLIAISDREVLVMQRPELTRLIDSDGDGAADVFETVTDDFGLSGNYHEFCFGPVMDAHGDLFIGLNVASNGDSIMSEIRGEFRHYGMKREEMYADWSKMKGKVGRMYSVVPYRGWVLKIDGKTGVVTPWASGFRSPNSLGFDGDGNLFVCDNQGDWLGSSKLFTVEKDKFYGHPASLVWRKDWKPVNPLDVPIAEIDKLRTRETLFFPQSIMANSPSQPLLDTTQGKFGPFANQLFVGEMNISRLMRVLPENVAGSWQGACLPFFDKNGLTAGTNRLAFDPRDGSLYVGHTHLSWAGGEGIQRIKWKGTVPMDIQGMTLTAKGFELRFTKPLAPETAGTQFEFKRYYYEYHQAYGAKQSDVAQPKVTTATLSADHTTISLTLDDLRPGYVYELNLKQVKAADSSEVINTLVCYTINRLRDGTPAPPQFGEGEGATKDKTAE
jgi:hypothetical protein